MNKNKTTLHTVKAYLVISLFLFTTLICMQSCIDNDNDGYHEWNNLLVSYGMFDKDNNTINTDEGKVLHLSPYNLKIADNKRVVAAYFIESSNLDGYRVNLYAIDTILTKNPVHSTYLTAKDEDNLGYLPVNMIKAWFSCNEYLNVEFDFLRGHPNIAHYINLWVDDEASTCDRKVVVLRHNNYSDPEYTWVSARTSFKIDTLIPEDRDSIKIVLKWKNYNGVARSDSGYFWTKPKITDFNENNDCLNENDDRFNENDDCSNENNDGFSEFDNDLK